MISMLPPQREAVSRPLMDKWTSKQPRLYKSRSRPLSSPAATAINHPPLAPVRFLFYYGTEPAQLPTCRHQKQCTRPGGWVSSAGRGPAILGIIDNIQSSPCSCSSQLHDQGLCHISFHHKWTLECVSVFSSIRDH